MSNIYKKNRINEKKTINHKDRKTSKEKTSKRKTTKTKTSIGKTSKRKTSKTKTSIGETSKTKPSKGGTSKAKTSKAKTSKVKTSKAKTSKAKTSKTKTSKAETSKAKTSKGKNSMNKRRGIHRKGGYGLNTKDYSPIIFEISDNKNNKKVLNNLKITSMGFSPISGYEPRYEPHKWNLKEHIKSNHNCYSYALNDKPYRRERGISTPS